MRWHFSYDYLPRWFMPKVIDAQATLGISSIATILDVPIGCLALPLPIQIKLIFAAVRISNAVLNNFFAQTTLTAAYPSVTTDRS